MSFNINQKYARKKFFLEKKEIIICIRTQRKLIYLIPKYDLLVVVDGVPYICVITVNFDRKSLMRPYGGAGERS